MYILFCINYLTKWGEGRGEGNLNKDGLLSPALSSFVPQEERENCPLHSRFRSLIQRQRGRGEGERLSLLNSYPQTLPATLPRRGHYLPGNQPTLAPVIVECAPEKFCQSNRSVIVSTTPIKTGRIHFVPLRMTTLLPSRAPSIWPRPMQNPPPQWVT